MPEQPKSCEPKRIKHDNYESHASADKQFSNFVDANQTHEALSPNTEQTFANHDVQMTYQPLDPFFIEVCAGSARVTTCLQFFGLKSSFGVDHKRQKSSGRILVADLTTATGQAICRQWFSSPNCVGIFAAPPCGTCSRARGIPVKLPDGIWVPGPKPLRTDAKPDGVDTLTPLEQTRVNSANSLYAFITELSLACLASSKIVCIENPRSSLYWRTSFFLPLAKKLAFTVHQACAYGSSRPKWTLLAHNTKTLHKLNNLCPGIGPHHKHKPWGLTNGGSSFSTSEETAYPMKLAFYIAYFLAQQLTLKGWKPPAGELTMPDELSYQYLRSVTGVQPKASKLPPLVSAFAAIVTLNVPPHCNPPVAPGDKLLAPWHTVPAGACLLKKPPRLTGGDNGTGRENEISEKLLTFGIYRSCENFVQKAVEVGHPFGREAKLPAVLEEAVAFVSSHSEHQVARLRLKELDFWLGRAKCLAAEESKFHKKLPDPVKGILAPKRLLLWKEMLTHYGYPDCEVFDEVVQGFELTGTVGHVRCFDPCFKPAKITAAELEGSACAGRQSLLGSVRSSGDAFIDSEVFAKTQDEVNCGWLEGPFELSELPPNAVVSRRFGIKQGVGDKLKVRLIDDFSASGVNSTVQVDSNAKLHTLDVVAALCMELLRASPEAEWVGKTVDLSAAYRQLALSPKSRWVSFVAVFDPVCKKPRIY